MSGWGYSESPLVDGDQVVCTPGGKNGTMAAFNKKTGDLIWRSKDWTDKAAYSSTVAADIGGVHQYVQMTGDSVGGVDAKDGKLLWKYERNGPTAAIPTPIVSGDYVFVTSGYGAGCNLIKVTKDGDKFKAEEVYSDKDMTNHHGGVVLVDGDIYGYSRQQGRWLCKDMKIAARCCGRQAKDETKLGKGSLTCRRRPSVLLQRGQGDGRAGEGHAGRLDRRRAGSSCPKRASARRQGRQVSGRTPSSPTASSTSATRT